MKKKSDDYSSREFRERKSLIELQEKLDLKKHNLKMKEFEYIRNSEKIKHDLELERQRIKGAEIKRNMERKENLRFMGDYPKR